MDGRLPPCVLAVAADELHPIDLTTPGFFTHSSHWEALDPEGPRFFSLYETGVVEAAHAFVDMLTQNTSHFAAVYERTSLELPAPHRGRAGGLLVELTHGIGDDIDRNRWYDRTYAPNLLRAGYRSAYRYTRDIGEPDQLALYEVPGDPPTSAETRPLLEGVSLHGRYRFRRIERSSP